MISNTSDGNNGGKKVREKAAKMRREEGEEAQRKIGTKQEPGEGKRDHKLPFPKTQPYSESPCN